MRRAVGVVVALALTAPGILIASHHASGTPQFCVQINCISINDVSGDDGSSATTPFTFVVSASKALVLGCSISVAFTTHDGTAQGGTDYAATSGAVMISGGRTPSGKIAVNVIGDTDATSESDLTFNVNLGTPFHTKSCGTVSVVKATGVGTILNAEPAPTPSPTPSPTPTPTPGQFDVAGGKASGKVCTFTIALSPAQSSSTSVDWTASGDVGRGAITGTATFAPGVGSQAVALRHGKKGGRERDETLTLSNPTGGATIGTASADCDIKHK